MGMGGGVPFYQQLGAVLDTIDVKKPRIPVVSNVDAEPHSDPSVIKDILKKQVHVELLSVYSSITRIFFVLQSQRHASLCCSLSVTLIRVYGDRGWWWSDMIGVAVKVRVRSGTVYCSVKSVVSVLLVLQ